MKRFCTIATFHCQVSATFDIFLNLQKSDQNNAISLIHELLEKLRSHVKNKPDINSCRKIGVFNDPVLSSKQGNSNRVQKLDIQHGIRILKRSISHKKRLKRVVRTTKIHEYSTLECRTNNLVRKTRSQKKMRCSMCRRRFLSETELKSHEDLRHLNAAVSCRRCKKEFKNASIFTKHSCTKNSARKCDLCGHVFMCLQSYLKHKAGHNRNKCSLCDKSFSRRKFYFDHMKDEHKIIEGNDTFIHCERCVRMFRKKKSLFLHYKEHALAENKVVCLKCGLFFDDQSQLNNHELEHKTLFECERCLLKFSRKQQFNMHMDGHDKYDCILCDAPFSTLITLTRHKRQVHGTKPKTRIIVNKEVPATSNSEKSSVVAVKDKRRKCGVCGMEFRKSAQLKAHKRSHTSRKPEAVEAVDVPVIQELQVKSKVRSDNASSLHKPDLGDVTNGWMNDIAIEPLLELPRTQVLQPVIVGNDVQESCTRSGSSLMALDSINKENNISPETKKFLCAYCGSSLYSKQSLKRHVKQTHSDERLFACPFCEHKCKCKANLKRHMELHTDESQKFICELCGAVFRSSSALKDHHSYVHSDDKNHVCLQCGKGFKVSSALNRHMKIHNNSRPYMCFCKQAYKRLTHLKSHMKSRHGTEFTNRRVKRLEQEAPNDDFFLYGDDDSAEFYDIANAFLLPITTNSDGILVPINDGRNQVASQNTVINQTQSDFIIQELGQIENGCGHSVVNSEYTYSNVTEMGELHNYSLQAENDYSVVKSAQTLPSIHQISMFRNLPPLSQDIFMGESPSNVADLNEAKPDAIETELYGHSLAQYLEI